MGAGQHADAPTLGEPGDPDGRAGAAGDPAAARAQRVVHLDEGGAGTDVAVVPLSVTRWSGPDVDDEAPSPADQPG